MPSPDPIRFYFSFRSPYAWLAAERIDIELAGHSVEFELVPLFPTPATFPNDPVRMPNKLRYLLCDITRLAREYQLPLKLGGSIETDWAKAHAAFLGADELGAGRRFMLEMFRARFGHAQDVARDEVIAEACQRSDLPAEPVLAAAYSPTKQAAVSENFLLGQKRDAIFGVPSFVYRNQLFWGHDRLGALRRALVEASAGVHASA